jgi:Cu/Ag efflux protein CusF
VKTSTLIGLTLILTVALTLTGCGTVGPGADTKQETAAAGASGASSASGAVAIKRYPMHGKIISVDVAAKSARIEAGPLGDWMGAMTMNYTIKDDAGLAKLAAGDAFDATVFVQGDDFWVGEIKPVAK